MRRMEKWLRTFSCVLILNNICLPHLDEKFVNCRRERPDKAHILTDRLRSVLRKFSGDSRETAILIDPVAGLNQGLMK